MDFRQSSFSSLFEARSFMTFSTSTVCFAPVLPVCDGADCEAVPEAWPLV
jgi:hypothetical protein